MFLSNSSNSSIFLNKTNLSVNSISKATVFCPRVNCLIERKNLDHNITNIPKGKFKRFLVTLSWSHISCHTAIPLGVAVAGLGGQIVGKLSSLAPPPIGPFISHFDVLISHCCISWVTHTLIKYITKFSGSWHSTNCDSYQNLNVYAPKKYTKVFFNP